MKEELAIQLGEVILAVILVVTLLALGMDRPKEEDEEKENMLKREQQALERTALYIGVLYIALIVWQ